MYSALLTTLAGVMDVLADYVQRLGRPQEVRWKRVIGLSDLYFLSNFRIAVNNHIYRFILYYRI